MSKGMEFSHKKWKWMWYLKKKTDNFFLKIMKEKKKRNNYFLF